MTEKKNKHPFLLIICIGLAIIIGSLMIIVNEINRPIRHDNQVATEIAKKKTNLKNIDRVTRFVYNEVGYTVSGTSADGTSLFVVITDDGKQVTVYNQNSGINEQKAISSIEKSSNLKKITSSRFGIIKDKPVWIISYLDQKDNLVIKTIDFKTGKEIKSITTY